MRYDEYCRLHEACLAMAKQVTEQKMRERWSTMADAWLKRATELHELSGEGAGVKAGHTAPNSIGAPDPGQQAAP
jgi:hypothetical protein